MEQNISCLPVFIQNKMRYRECLLERQSVCCCYELQSTDELVYIPDGGTELIWNIDRKEWYCLNCSCDVTTIEKKNDRLFGIHIDALYKCVYQPQALQEWMEQAGALDSLEEWVIYCNRTLLQVIQIEEVPPLVRYAVEQIRNAKGKIVVAEISPEFSYTLRQLERLFQKYYFCGVKRLCQYVRLRCTVSYMAENQGQSFSNLAKQSGYSDQSHFQRDFKRFTGMTPKQFSQRYLEYP